MPIVERVPVIGPVISLVRFRAGSGESPARDDRALALAPTPTNPLGPAYRDGAPFRSTLSPPNRRGEPLLVHGVVRSAASGAPLPGVLLEVWQTDARGHYSDLLGFALGRSEHLWMRGRLLTDARGEYELRTIVPGRYPLGPLSRPRHIHFMATVAGFERLVTQLYFAGDPLLARDRYARPPLIVTPEPERGPRGKSVRFDLALAPASHREVDGQRSE